MHTDHCTHWRESENTQGGQDLITAASTAVCDCDGSYAETFTDKYNVPVSKQANRGSANPMILAL